MPLPDLLTAAARRHPAKDALVHPAGRTTYAELHAAAGRIAGALAAAGVAPRDRVVLYLADHAATAAAMFGVSRAGAAFVVVDAEVKARKLAHIVADSGARAVVTDAPHLLERPPPWPAVAAVIAPDAPGPDVADAEVGDGDLCCLAYTSGSTGVPKGVALSHGNVLAALGAIAGYLELAADERILNLSPLAFDYGLYNVLLAVHAGATVVLPGPIRSPHQIVQALGRHAITGLPLVPTLAALLVRVPRLDRYDLSGVRYVTSTGQPLPPAVSSRLQALFPAARVYSMYGLTECKRVSYLPPAELAARPGSVGKPMPGTEAWIVDGAGRRVTAPGEVGELLVRGPHVMQGYWGRPAETARVIADGPGGRVLRTGDLFTQDAGGYLYFVGRTDDMIKTGGELVSPREVEDAAYLLPDVVSAVAVGVPDEILGTALKLVVTVAPGSALTAADVRRRCAAELERTRVPRVVEIRAELPTTTSGKIDRRALAEAGPPR